jgi:hypothetical protein
MMNDFSVERGPCQHPLRMGRMSGTSIGALLGTGAMLLVMGGALGGCNARTELADVTDGGEGGTSSEQSGGSTSGGRPSNQGGSATGGSAAGEPSGGATGGTGSGATGGTGSGATGGTDSGATGGTGSGATGGTANAGGSPAGGGTGGQCWDPTVDAYCHFFPCPPRGGDPEHILDFFEATHRCEAAPVLVDYDTCGAEIYRVGGGYSSESYMYISGTLGATANWGDTPFGPCDLFHYYGGIELDEFYEEYGCSVVNRCVACGPDEAGDSQYPPCRSDCQCVDVVIGADPCFDPTSCECYCAQGLPKDD